MSESPSEAKLLRLAESCKEFMDFLPYPVSIHDAKYNVIAANKSFYEMAGTLGPSAKCYNIVHGSGSPPDGCPVVKAMHSRMPVEAELYEPRLDRHMLVNAHPIIENGSVIGFTHTMTDITKLKMSEENHTEVIEMLGESLAEIKSREDSLVKSRDAFLNMLEDITESYKDLEELFIGLVTALVSALDAKSRWTMGHSERVSNYAEMIAKEMGLAEDEKKNIKLAGILHDIGKIGTYDYVLDKPGKLTDEEFAAIKKHPAQGADFLRGIKQLKGIIPLMKYHHERMDGRGYPDGLKGEDIPLGARILHVADTFDAIMADRPYRPSPGYEYAVSELKKYSGIQFDATVVEAFLRVISPHLPQAAGG